VSLVSYGTFNVTLCGLSAALTARARVSIALASAIAAESAARADDA
jgi:hypothetical protein